MELEDDGYKQNEIVAQGLAMTTPVHKGTIWHSISVTTIYS